MRARIALVTAPVVLLLWLGIGIYLFQKFHADLNAAEQASRNLTRAFEENIRRTIEAIDTTIRAARVARAHDPTGFDLLAWERASGLTRELTLQLSLADRTGSVLVTNLDTMAVRRVNIADREHFRVPRDAASDELFISRPVLGRISGRWSVQFVRRLTDRDGAFDGVIVASVDPAFLSRFYASLDIGHGALLLLGLDGMVRSAAPDTVAKLSDDMSATIVAGGVASAAQGTVRWTSPLDAADRIISWRRVDPYDLTVAVGLSRDDALTDFRHDSIACLFAGLGASILILAVSAALARNRGDLMLSREMLRAAVDNISQGLLVVDAQRRVPVLNARAAELLGLPPHLAQPGIAFDTLLEWQIASGEFAGAEAAPVRKLVRAGGIEPGTSIYSRTRRDGTALEIRTKMLDTGLAVRTFTDITEQQNAARVLADARDAAEAAAGARSEFLAMMSHEIRTPLNGVIGVAGLLEDTELGAAQRDYVRIIRQSGDHLLELINDILDFSRLEAERVELEAVDFDPVALLRGVAGMFETQAEAKGLRLTVSAGASPRVTGDPLRLRQILLNLLSNAMKFTEHGSIMVTMTPERLEAGRVRLFFAVTDSGIGIEPHAIDRMFQAFTQMDGSISRRFGGSGLGLAICRRLVEMMDGQIAVESQPGQGSTFRFDVTVPVAAAAPASDLSPEPDDGPALDILLAEDNPTNQMVARRLLERLGHRADAVGDGAAAIEAWGRKRYDLILMDVMMPEMDGLAVTRHIRATEPPGMRIAIVGLTAGSGREALDACLDAGMDAMATKPVTLDRLRAAIAQGCRPLAHPLPRRPVNNRRLLDLADELGEDAVAEVVQAFAEDTAANLAAMRDAADRGETTVVRRLAHSVAGAARTVGADTFADRAAALEESVGTMGAPDIAAAAAALQEAFNAVFKDLDWRRPDPACRS